MDSVNKTLYIPLYGKAFVAKKSGLVFVNEYNMTPQKYIDELRGAERLIFKNLFAGKIAQSMYRMYEYKKM